jgi:hypothetical protein
MIDKLLPPVCARVRFLVAAITIAVAIPRIPGVTAPSSTLAFFDHGVYAFSLLPVGIALAITSYRGRLRFAGRFVAVLGFAAWVTLAFASPSATSILIDIILAVTLLLEIISRHDC